MFKLFKKSYAEKDLAIFRFLSRNKLFESLTDEELEEFLPYLHKRQYKENEVVFFANDPSNALYIIKNGIVSLNIDVKEHMEKLAVLRNGKLFGDNAILENTKRVYTALVISESAELYVIPKINLLQIMEDEVQIKAKLMGALAEEYSDYVQNLFKAYQTEYGFFDINMIYNNNS